MPLDGLRAQAHCVPKYTGTPDEALFTEIKMLNGFNEDQFAGFLSRIFEFLCGQTSIEFMEAVSAFASEHSVNINALKGPLRGSLLISTSKFFAHCLSILDISID